MDNMCVGVLIFFGVILFSAGHSCSTQKHNKEAVDKGHAEWVVINSSGTSEFRWLESKEKE